MMIDPVHQFFGLSYSSYLVLPRAAMEQMPTDWQAKMVALLEEAQNRFDDELLNVEYSVNVRGKKGKFKKDPLANYRRPIQLKTKA